MYCIIYIYIYFIVDFGDICLCINLHSVYIRISHRFANCIQPSAWRSPIWTTIWYIRLHICLSTLGLVQGQSQTVRFLPHQPHDRASETCSSAETTNQNVKIASAVDVPRCLYMWRLHLTSCNCSGNRQRFPGYRLDSSSAQVTTVLPYQQAASIWNC